VTGAPARGRAAKVTPAAAAVGIPGVAPATLMGGHDG
jgi:hypothetical protein